MNTVREQTKAKQKKVKTNDNTSPLVDGKARTGKSYSKITEASVRRVIKLIESGESERQACIKTGINNSSFRQAVTRLRVSEDYTRATSALAEQQINLMEKTIEDLRNGTITSDMARVELDARKWFASKLLPKKYGDKVEHEGNVNVVFHNGIPRPKYIEGDTTDAISSVPSQIEGNKDPA